MGNPDVALMAHLMRRAGFGATRDQLQALVAKGYDATVEELLAPGDPQAMPDDVIRRYDPEMSAMMYLQGSVPVWLYRMVTTNAPLEEKIALFWHGIFATGTPKITQGKVLSDQIRMFRRYGRGSFKTLLVELSKNPAMIVWLDNQDNHKGAINENFGRELLELFSMGAGNYTEEDIKECARAFTGWTIGNTEYMAMRGLRNSVWPYGCIAWHFEYRPDAHDDGEKEFLGHRGRFNGEEIIDIICEQQATARFISRHMYHFFVADEPAVPQWPYTPPRDPEAIEILCNAYFESQYDILSMLRVLFNSDFFRSESCWYEKVKSPAEVMSGVLRLTGKFNMPRREITDRFRELTFMGQSLNNPPSVEGWHQGVEWINTGSLVERANFASQQLGDLSTPGTQAIMERLSADNGGTISPERLVDICLDHLGAISVSEATREALVRHASQGGEVQLGPDGPGEQARQQVGAVLQMVAGTREFQRC